MKWVLLGLGILALAVSALFGVGYFVLPSKLIVSQQTQIDRHRSMVFPLGANLASFHEWSPWARFDPMQRYEVQGSAGLGQQARYRSAASQIGEGSYKITALTPNSSVTVTAQGGPLASGALAAALDLSLEDASGGALTVWRFSRECGPNLDGVFCRYMNLALEASARTALEQGLARLKRLAEDLPALDISDVEVSLESRPAMPFAFVESASDKTDGARVAQAILGASAFVQQYFQARQITTFGPRVVVMTKDDERQAAFRVGYVFDGPAPTDADPTVRIGETPSGKAARMVHNGPNDRMPVSYALFNAYLRAHRIEPDGLPWEVLIQAATQEDQTDARTEIYIPVK